MEQTETELSFFGSTPLVHINAESCGVVTVNYRIIIETRPHDTLRREAARIDREMGLAQGSAA